MSGAKTVVVGVVVPVVMNVFQRVSSATVAAAA